MTEATKEYVESLKKFELLVKEMRETQKEYFRTLDKDVLKKSKALEKQVDDHFLSKKPELPKQEYLF